jgi:hypothetical protein
LTPSALASSRVAGRRLSAGRAPERISSRTLVADLDVRGNLRVPIELEQRLVLFLQGSELRLARRWRLA